MYIISKNNFCTAMLNAGFRSFKQLSKASGVSELTISRINRGYPAKLATIGALADVLHVEPVSILAPEKVQE